jgi:hypothetical protein
MSKLTEIEEAIRNLPAPEREMLEARMLSMRFGLETLDVDERSQLLASLDDADAEIDAGLGVSANELREAVRSWTGR